MQSGGSIRDADQVEILLQTDGVQHGGFAERSIPGRASHLMRCYQRLDMEYYQYVHIMLAKNIVLKNDNQKMNHFGEDFCVWSVAEVHKSSRSKISSAARCYKRYLARAAPSTIVLQHTPVLSAKTDPLNYIRLEQG